MPRLKMQDGRINIQLRRLIRSFHDQCDRRRKNRFLFLGLFMLVSDWKTHPYGTQIVFARTYGLRNRDRNLVWGRCTSNTNWVGSHHQDSRECPSRLYLDDDPHGLPRVDNGPVCRRRDPKRRLCKKRSAQRCTTKARGNRAHGDFSRCASKKHGFKGAT